MKICRTLAAAGVLCTTTLWYTSVVRADTGGGSGSDRSHRSVQRVLLLSIDGMHAIDLANYIKSHPNSTLAQLAAHGATYSNASTAKPSDSFPGILSMITGGSPVSTGVWYDDSYDHSLSPPGSSNAVGAEVVYDESIDKNTDALDGGGGIDPAKLPRDPRRGFQPVYPHQFLRVNTIFEVIKSGGGRTAWSDKHPAYELLNGPSGQGLDDLYTPEIASKTATGIITDSITDTEAYDDLKVQAILNEINGKNHAGTASVGVPNIFGMNFQAVSVGEKLPVGGYMDVFATPTPGLQGALDHTDQSLGKMVQELRKRNLFSSTVIIVTAKHGQTPIDPGKRQIIDKSMIPNLVNSVQSNLAAQVTQDDIALIWLTDHSKAQAVVTALSVHQDELGVQEILSGEAVKLYFNDPLLDPRTPDIIVLPRLGVIYTGSKATKIAEHGGFNSQDLNVPILLSSPLLGQTTVKSPVETMQIAPSILSMLGYDPHALQAVRIEKTDVLPGIGLLRSPIAD